ncbi:ATP-binding protein [Paucibacter sp. AS339]|uniref:sensor histidine kinase n=1 Tax=Paucibacter hankyongi TaxID=3133434 RepID=UPI0030AA3263
MNSLSEARNTAQRLPRWSAVLLLALGLGLLMLALAGLFFAARQVDGLGLASLLLVGLCTAMLLLGMLALGWHVGVRLTRQQLGEALRESRMQTQALAQLRSDHLWCSDAEHHLVRWQAPQAGPVSSWVGQVATECLWQRFGLQEWPPTASADAGGGDANQAKDAIDAIDSGEALRRELSRGLTTLDLRVVSRDATKQGWRLRAVAQFDGQGRFSGYQGSAQELLEAPTAWLEALPGPAWLLDHGRTASSPDAVHLRAQNTQAAALMGPEVSVGASWTACTEQLSPLLGEALAKHPPRSFTDASGRYQLAVLWPQAPAEPEALRDEAASQSAHEHESFSYTVSHDLRAPLRVVEGFARILKEDYGRVLDRIGNDHLDRVMGAAARMNSMIDSLLSLAQLSAQPLARQPVNLSQLAGFVLEELMRAAPDRQVAVHIQPHMLAQGDPTLLRMVLENLLGNAWKYSGKRAQAQIRFEALQESGQWIYRVSDNGAGFDMRFADRLFGVFQRLHSASDFQGTGVGLASVRRIVRRHGGEIWAESEVGEGARFYFTLAG